MAVPFDLESLVDDYYLFGRTKEEARQSLAYLAEILSAHEGLSLQRAKTRLMSGEEFARTSPRGSSGS